MLYRNAVQINSSMELTWVSTYQSGYTDLLEGRVENINIFQYLYGKIRGAHVTAIKVETDDSSHLEFYKLMSVVLVFLIGMMTTSVSAKNKVVTKESNTSKVEVIQEENTPQTPEATQYIIKIKEVSYIIYKGPKGGFYIERISSKGKKYKQYIKKELYEQLKKN